MVAWGRSMRNFAMLVMVATLCGGAWAQKPETPLAFRDDFISALKAADPAMKIEITDTLGLKIGHELPLGSFVTLDNSYQRYLADPSHRSDIFAQMIRQVRDVLNPPPEYADAKQRLIAMPRPRDYLKGLPVAISEKDTLTSRPFVGDLILVLMIDGDERLEAVSAGRLAKLGLDTDGAFKLAAENLPKRLGELHQEKVGPILYTNAKSGIAVALLGLPDACTKSPDSQQLVLVANREYFYSVPTADKAAVDQLTNVARGMIRDGVSLSHALIECRAGVWRETPIF
jgi:hypothetical protein